MVTVYHNLDRDVLSRLADAHEQAHYQPTTQDLELIAVVDRDDLHEAFDRVIHRDGEDWPSNPGLTVFGSSHGHRSAQDGDVFVTADGLAHLVLPVGFRSLPGLVLPFL